MDSQSFCIPKTHDQQEARKAVQILFSRVRFGAGECVEVRMLGKGDRPAIVSGWFDDPELLAKAICKLARDGFGAGTYRHVQESIYWTINPVDDALLSRQDKNKLAFVNENTVDNNITRRLWFPIDIDPIRAKGVSATIEERKLALEVANNVIAKLQDLGFSENSIVGGTSGNGYHILVAVDLPNDEGNKNLLKRCLLALQATCGNGRVDVDLKVFNAARILKGYGTLARKGANTEQRPWRMSKLNLVPATLEAASKELLVKLAELVPIKDTKRAINATPQKPRSGKMTQEIAQRVLDDADIDADPEPENYSWSDSENVQRKGLKWKHRCLIDPDNHGRNVAYSILENGWLNHYCMHKNTHEGVEQKNWRAAWEELTEQRYPKPFVESPRFATEFMDADADLLDNADLTKPLTPEQEAQMVKEVEKVAEQVVEDKGEIPQYNYTDMGNAERLLWRYADRLRHSMKGGWYFWRKTHWKADADKLIWAAAKVTVRKIEEEASKWVNELSELDRNNDAHKERIKKLEGKINKVLEWAQSSESKGRLQAMIDLAKMSLQVDIDVDAFDADPLLFNVKNGTIDLRTGELLPHRKEDYITNVVPVVYDPKAECPLWLEFLNDITGGDQNLIGYLQRSAGYTMTGLTEEHCLFMPHGIGRNGKSTFVETIQYVMGGYAIPANMDMFLVKKVDGGIPNDLAALHKARMVTAVESDDGKRLAEAKIKQITGGDTITARFLHKEFFSFKPQFKIWLVTNHLPAITGQDEGIWRRIKRVPFEVVIPPSKVDETLPKKLRAEASGILNWMLKGLEEYRLHGLDEPEVVTRATEDYREGQDWLARFLSECTEPARNNSECTQVRPLYTMYVDWAKRVGEFVNKEVKFIEAMARAGHPSKRVRRGDKVMNGFEKLKIRAYTITPEPSIRPDFEDAMLAVMEEEFTKQ